MNAQAHIAKLPRVSSIDIAVAAFVLWLMVDDLLLQGREFELFAYLRLVALLLCYVVVRLLRCRAVIVLGAVTVWTLVEVAVALLQLGSIIESNHLLYGMTGTFGNPGPLGGFVAMGIVVMAGLMTTMRNKAATATVAALTCLAAVVLVCADSRAGWLATAVGIAYLFGRYIARAWRRIPIWGKCVALVVSAGVLVAAYFYKEKSANGRLLIWRTTIDMIADSPLTGHGSGSHAEQYMYYQAKYFEANPESPLADRAGVVDRSFNDLLRVWSEGGLVALLIVVFIVCHRLAGKKVATYRQRGNVEHGHIRHVFLPVIFATVPVGICRIARLRRKWQAWWRQVQNSGCRIGIGGVCRHVGVLPVPCERCRCTAAGIDSRA